MHIVAVFLVVSILIWTVLFVVPRSTSRHPKGVRLPPGPYPLPIIGNILQLGRNPHRSLARLSRSLAQLSKTYGPLMSVKLGCCNIVVVTSPQLAKEMLTKHDQALSGRFTPTAFESWDHHKYSLSSLPVGSQWRKYRKICKEQVFSKRKLEGSQGLRRDKLQQLYHYVKECCISGRAVNIEEVAFTTTLNLISATLFSLDLGDLGSDSIRDLKGAVLDLINTLGAPNLADFFPVLKVIDPQGIKRRGKLSFGKMLAIIDDLIQQRLLDASAGSSRKNDILEVLLDPKNGKDYDLSINDIKHLLLELLIGGADTTSTPVDWAMTELLLNPDKLTLLKDELRTVIGKDKQVEESDISRLPYLQAVIKEVLRYHPPGPFLLPHKAEADIQVSGYTIPKDTKIFIHVWCMGRDPSIWPNPDSFQPERFLDSNIDFGGQHFELIPFGSGRRICPGMPLANLMLHLIVAFLVHNFDWKLEPDREVDLRKNGLSIRRRVPLMAVPSNDAFQRLA